MTIEKRHLFAAAALGTALLTPLAFAGPKKATPKAKVYDKPVAKAPSLHKGSSEPSNISGPVESIQTDPSGKVWGVGIRVSASTTKFAKGCGMRLANVPHLADAMGSDATVTLRVQDECIQSVLVLRNPPTP